MMRLVSPPVFPFTIYVSEAHLGTYVIPFQQSKQTSSGDTIYIIISHSSSIIHSFSFDVCIKRPNLADTKKGEPSA